MGGEGEPVVVAEWLRKALESERVAPPVMEWVMCPTCCGFVWRKKRSSAEVDEMLADVRLMRAAVMLPELHEILDDEGPDAAMKKRLEILLRRRRRMMERKRCPTCFRSLLDMPDEEDKAMVADAGSKKPAVGDETMAADAGSNKKKNKRSEEEEEEEEEEEGKKKKNKRSKEGKKKNKRSMEEPRSGKKRKMVASEGEAMVVDLGSREDSEYSMGLTGKSSSESSNQYSIGLTGKSSSESSGEYSMGRTGKRRTKMVTCRLSKEFVQEFIQTHPPIRPFAHSTIDHIERMHARQIAEYEVECEVHEDWKNQCDIKGYVEYQEEVTDNEDA